MASIACTAQSWLVVGLPGFSAQEMVPPLEVSVIAKSLMKATSRSPSPSTSYGDTKMSSLGLVVIVYFVQDGFLNHTRPADPDESATTSGMPSWSTSAIAIA